MPYNCVVVNNGWNNPIYQPYPLRFLLGNSSSLLREGELVIKERLHFSLIPLAFSLGGKLVRRDKTSATLFLMNDLFGI
jgi:hypothetical protein